MKHSFIFPLCFICCIFLAFTGCTGQSSKNNKKAEETGTTASATENLYDTEHPIEKQELQIESNGKQLYACICRPTDLDGALPAVAFVHGWGGSGDNWSHEASYMAQHGIVCCYFDVSGGSAGSRSEGNTRSWSVLTEKEDILNVLSYMMELEYVDTGALFLCGQSFGGLCSMLAAEECQEALAGLILYYPALTCLEQYQYNGVDPSSLPETFDDGDGMILSRSFFDDAQGIDPYENMEQFEKPVLMIHGDKDNVVPISVSRHAQELLPDSELIVMEGEGHGFSGMGVSKAMLQAMDFIYAQMPTLP